MEEEIFKWNSSNSTYITTEYISQSVSIPYNHLQIDDINLDKNDYQKRFIATSCSKFVLRRTFIGCLQSLNQRAESEINLWHTINFQDGYEYCDAPPFCHLVLFHPNKRDSTDFNIGERPTSFENNGKTEKYGLLKIIKNYTSDSFKWSLQQDISILSYVLILATCF